MSDVKEQPANNMPNDNEFLTSLQQEGSLSQAEQEKQETDTPAKSSTENKPETATPETQAGTTDDKVVKTEDTLPFHENPRWIKMQNELKELREFKQTSQPLLDQVAKPTPVTETDEIPAWFITLYGENEQAWKQYRLHSKQEREEIRSEIMQELKAQTEQGAKESQKWDQWVEDELQTLKDSGLKFERNELLKVAMDYLPTDTEGNISLKKAHDILVAQKSATNAPKTTDTPEKKAIAAKTMGAAQGDPGKRDYKTSQDLRFRSFQDIANE